MCRHAASDTHDTNASMLLRQCVQTGLSAATDRRADQPDVEQHRSHSREPLQACWSALPRRTRREPARGTAHVSANFAVEDNDARVGSVAAGMVPDDAHEEHLGEPHPVGVAHRGSGGQGLPVKGERGEEVEDESAREVGLGDLVAVGDPARLLVGVGRVEVDHDVADDEDIHHELGREQHGVGHARERAVRQPDRDHAEMVERDTAHDRVPAPEQQALRVEDVAARHEGAVLLHRALTLRVAQDPPDVRPLDLVGHVVGREHLEELHDVLARQVEVGVGHEHPDEVRHHVDGQ
eukprot:934348-Rhodomonas_salina.2